jgi:hypothetical protein
MPEEIGRLKSAVEAMLQDWRLRTVVAHEGRNVLGLRFKSLDGPGLKLSSGHADTYRVSFQPSSVIRQDIARLRGFFDDSRSAPEQSSVKKKPLVMIDDHIDNLTSFDNNEKMPGKKHAIWQAMLECSNDQRENISWENGWSWESIYKEAGLPFSGNAWDWQEYDHFSEFTNELWKSSVERASETDIGEPVILLDFLFSKEAGARQFGTTLIEELIAPLENSKDHERLQHIIDRGPFAVFFISSFTWGVWDKLNEGSFPLHSGSLFVDLGQDPVCFPEMFVKKLLQFLVSRETRPLMNALETVEKAEDALLASLKSNNNQATARKLASNAYLWTGIIAAYIKEIKNMKEKCLLDAKTPVVKLADSIVESPMAGINFCLERYLFASPEDCRVIYSELAEGWPPDVLQNNHFVNRNKNLAQKVNDLRKQIQIDLKTLMDKF